MRAACKLALPGDLLIPEDKFIHTENNHNNDIIISLFHHNTGWLSQTLHIIIKKHLSNIYIPILIL